MNILLLHHCDSWGGAGVSLLNVVKTLSKKYQVTILLPHKESELAKHLRKFSKQIYEFGFEPGTINAYSGGPPTLGRTFAKSLFAIPRTARIIQNICNDNQIDLLVANSMTTAWIGRYVQDIPVICFVRETLTDNLGCRLIRYCLERYCTAVSFLTEYDRKQFALHLVQTVVIPDYIDEPVEDYRKCVIGRDKSVFTVLFVGGASRLKGYETLMKTVQILAEEKKVHFVVAGDVPNDKKIKTSNITYVGLKEDLSTYYKECDVLAFPSLKPHQSRPAFEAGMYGKPVIISDFAETCENVQHEYNGLTFQPNDPKELAKCILRLKNDENLRNKLGENNLQIAMQKHSKTVCEKQIYELVESVM